MVNGFSCRNCSDVARAKRNIDPADPLGGHFGTKGAAKNDRSASSPNLFDRAAIDSLKHAHLTGRPPGSLVNLRA